ncbi:hypothetical protein COX08_02480 [Candidatus Beckwithbacteria bacterium CG23_combo_of_CG06-09_8_20_14_all_34_8]|uniref:Peptidase C39-like domain-containing protein n=1 Tax=Candidatus Beckwithbacteria bacterium CG23_combo_of_CG06-09_8_20_14_all_34_8 TaxID=1974497 RepID=A0A2H0B693_9BACT|nr:MAG: hypothetical protein COX08_02480 [Candidatus Beckwithbacteria bacterium CG23_combo_of_CG06-09_8_20_14_all_34_8]
MKQIPFVSNHRDNMHCVNAVFRMVHQCYFGKDLTWKEIDSMTMAIPGKATWTFIGEMEFAKKGLHVVNIEPVDYQKLHDEGVDYLKKILGNDTASYYLNKSNIVSVIKFIPQYLKVVYHETRRASLGEIVKFLKQGKLIGVEINSRILNHKAGFSLHFVLLYDLDKDNNIILHDPGLPPIKSRKITIIEFDQCFNFDGANGGVTVFDRD